MILKKASLSVVQKVRLFSMVGHPVVSLSASNDQIQETNVAITFVSSSVPNT